MSIMSLLPEPTDSYIEPARTAPLQLVSSQSVSEAEAHKSGVAAAFSVIYCAGFLAGLLVGWMLWKR